MFRPVCSVTSLLFSIFFLFFIYDLLISFRLLNLICIIYHFFVFRAINIKCHILQFPLQNVFHVWAMLRASKSQVSFFSAQYYFKRRLTGRQIESIYPDSLVQKKFVFFNQNDEDAITS